MNENFPLNNSGTTPILRFQKQTVASVVEQKKRIVELKGKKIV
jgi:hypothetical protein